MGVGIRRVGRSHGVSCHHGACVEGKKFHELFIEVFHNFSQHTANALSHEIDRTLNIAVVPCKLLLRLLTIKETHGILAHLTVHAG